MKEILDFIKENKVLYLATTEGDQARVRPISSLETVNGKFFFRTKTTKDVYKQLMANPKVEILFVSNNNMEWLRITAEAVVETAIEDRIQMLSGAHAGEPGLEAMRLQNAKAVFYDAKGVTKTVEF